MKFLVTLLVVVSIACIQVQGVEKSLPAHLIGESKKALKTAPAATTPEKVHEAINNPFENVADALAFFDPSRSTLYHRYAAFDIPFNRPVLASELQKNLNQKRIDKLSIITSIIASIKIPPSGLLKKVGLHLVKEFLCKIVQSDLLPGLENNVAYIMRSVRDNNNKSDGFGKSLINTLSDLPFIGGFLKKAGNTIYGLGPGIEEVLRIYSDDPLRIANALRSVSDDESLTTCTPVASPQPITEPLPHPPINFGPGPVIPPNA